MGEKDAVVPNNKACILVSTILYLQFKDVLLNIRYDDLKKKGNRSLFLPGCQSKRELSLFFFFFRSEIKLGGSFIVLLTQM